jgi:hypothetical protein
MMLEERKRNPIKECAMNLAHQINREKELDEYIHPNPRHAEIVREEGRYIRNEILKNGYGIIMILRYMEEYKSLGFKEYFEWIYI